MIPAIIGVCGLVALVIVANRWGASSRARKEAERLAEERANDTNIASKPYESHPFGRMRRKKD